MPMSDYLQQLRDKVGHELLLLPSAAVAVFDDQKRVLLARHSDRNIWVLPGGLIEPGEVPADAAVREVWEETGLLVELTGIFGVYGGSDLLVNYANGDVAIYVAIIFTGKIIGGKPQPDGTEILELRYFAQDEISTVPHSKWMDAALSTLFCPTGMTQFQPSTWRP